MTSRIKNLVLQAAGIGLAALLLYLALRHVDFSGMWRELQTANYWWLLPLVAATLSAHFLRAWRWRMFLDALPGTDLHDGTNRVPLGTAFNAVMIGYLLNMAVPRLGEVARTADLSSQTGVRFSSVFGTVVVERLLDFVVFLLILLGVGFVLAGSPAAEELLFKPLQARIARMPVVDLLWIVLIVAGLAAIAYLLIRRMRRSEKGGLFSRITPVLQSFRVGFVTLFTSPHRIGITITTFGIWFCYWLMLYMPLHMLGMIKPYGLDMVTGFVLLGTGSIGFVLPAPGGIGSYHYFVIETLVQIYAVPYNVAAGFAVLTHTAQIILLTVVGFACLLIQGTTLGGILKFARKAEGNSDSAPIFEDRTE